VCCAARLVVSPPRPIQDDRLLAATMSALVKAAIIGECGVGKSCLAIQFMQHTFLDRYDPTIGMALDHERASERAISMIPSHEALAPLSLNLIIKRTGSHSLVHTRAEDSYRKQVRTRRGTRMLEFLDTAAVKQFSTMRDLYIRASHGFLLVYSITNRQSFDELARYFEQIQRVKDVEYFPGVLIGNKIDLETERQVSFEEGQQLAERLELAFFETSAKSGMHVHEVRVSLSPSLSLSLSLSRCVCRSLSRSRHSHMKSAHTQSWTMHSEQAFCQVIEEIERKTPDIANTSRRPAKKRCHVQ